VRLAELRPEILGMTMAYETMVGDMGSFIAMKKGNSVCGLGRVEVRPPCGVAVAKTVSGCVQSRRSRDVGVNVDSF